MSDCARCEALKCLIEEDNLFILDLLRRMVELEYKVGLARVDEGSAFIKRSQPDLLRAQTELAELEHKMCQLTEEASEAESEFRRRLKEIGETIPRTCEPVTLGDLLRELFIDLSDENNASAV